ncbi:hypothetical protein HYDPIDRAFT_34688 [Hydnomerulius pinastri MD-312]|uniref:Uncharacterized protein n=1 Tax=Hydnomerulius pinastri MD-312 TaxID=994086 RepID=A0A0C9W6P8_9AGAM|nr:hypothetical protein HYDPIDRAFT_34688 [Hydnomerulius pinastri MD-312]
MSTPPIQANMDPAMGSQQPNQGSLKRKSTATRKKKGCKATEPTPKIPVIQWDDREHMERTAHLINWCRDHEDLRVKIFSDSTQDAAQQGRHHKQMCSQKKTYLQPLVKAIFECDHDPKVKDAYELRKKYNAVNKELGRMGAGLSIEDLKRNPGMENLLKKLTETFPWWEDLHGWWRTNPAYNTVFTMADPGQDFAAMAQDYFQSASSIKDPTTQLRGPAGDDWVTQPQSGDVDEEDDNDNDDNDEEDSDGEGEDGEGEEGGEDNKDEASELELRQMSGANELEEVLYRSTTHAPFQQDDASMAINDNTDFEIDSPLSRWPFSPASSHPLFSGHTLDLPSGSLSPPGHDITPPHSLHRQSALWLPARPSMTPLPYLNTNTGALVSQGYISLNLPTNPPAGLPPVQSTGTPYGFGGPSAPRSSISSGIPPLAPPMPRSQVSPGVSSSVPPTPSAVSPGTPPSAPPAPRSTASSSSRLPSVARPSSDTSAPGRSLVENSNNPVMSDVVHTFSVHAHKGKGNGKASSSSAKSKLWQASATSSTSTSSLAPSSPSSSITGSSSGSRKRPRDMTSEISAKLSSTSDLIVRQIQSTSEAKVETKRMKIEAGIMSWELKLRDHRAQREHDLWQSMVAHEHECAMASKKTRQLELELEIEKMHIRRLEIAQEKDDSNDTTQS